MELIPIDRDRAVAALERACGRFTKLLHSVTDPQATAVGHWTVGETAAHVAQSLALETAVLRGEGSPVESPEGVTDFNEEGLRRYTERDPKVIADRIESEARGLIDALGRSAWDEMVAWHAGIKLPVSNIPGILVGECLVHGFDIARADGKRWPIPRDEAVEALVGISELIPYYVDKQATRDLEASFEIRLRGGPRLYLVFDRGRATVEPEALRRVDVHISADPAAYLLIGYKRIGQVGPALKGQMLVWGRKPLLSFRLARAFKSP